MDTSKIICVAGRLQCPYCDWAEPIPTEYSGLGIPPGLLLSYSKHPCTTGYFETALSEPAWPR